MYNLPPPVFSCPDFLPTRYAEINTLWGPESGTKLLKSAPKSAPVPLSVLHQSSLISSDYPNSSPVQYYSPQA